jgi:hypothetical protein
MDFRYNEPSKVIYSVPQKPSKVIMYIDAGFGSRKYLNLPAELDNP